MSDHRGSLHLVTFHRGGTLFGVKVGRVRKVLRTTEIQPVSSSSPFVHGRALVEGRLEIVLDPAFLVGDSRAESPTRPRVILVRSGESEFAFVADSVDEVVEVPRDSVRVPPPFLTSAHGQVIEGCILREEEEVLILDLERLLELAETPASTPGRGTDTGD